MSNSILSKRLKEARTEAKISQKQLGINAGIDEFVASARMNQYETGKHVPDFSIMEKIADALSLPTAYFYSTDDKLAKIIKVYARLNSSKKRQLLTLIENM